MVRNIEKLSQEQKQFQPYTSKKGQGGSRMDLEPFPGPVCELLYYVVVAQQVRLTRLR